MERPLPHELAYRVPGTHTDPIWMEYLLKEVELELETRNQLLVSHFETLANVSQTRAEGFRNISQILAKGGATQAGP